MIKLFNSTDTLFDSCNNTDNSNNFHHFGTITYILD